jgi:hypothetical protein
MKTKRMMRVIYLTDMEKLAFSGGRKLCDKAKK